MPLTGQLTLHLSEANPRIIINRGGKQLDHRSQLLLQHVLHDNAVEMEQEDLHLDDEEEEAPMLMEEIQIEEQVDER